MGKLWRDIKFGLRMLLKSPGFTVVAVLSLALGIGANSAIFSLVDAVLLRPLNFKEPDRLVMIWEDASEIGFPRNTPAPANYADWKAQNQTFEDIGATTWKSYSLTTDGPPEKVEAKQCTANVLPMLGVQPLHGRFFSADEDKPGANHVALISYGLWQRRYGGDPGLIGRDILLDNQATTVLGVMPAGFQFLDHEIDLWVPKAFPPDELADRSSHYLNVVGRLKPGVSLQQAQADIQTITARIAHDHAKDAGALRANVFSMRQQLTGKIRPELLVLLAAVAMVLLIACVNLANLQLSRGAERGREIAVRTALGASRWRLTRQMLTESLLLALLGAAGGLLLAYLSFGFLKQLVPPSMALSSRLALNQKVLLFTVSVSIAAGVFFGLAPARQAGRVDLNEALKLAAGRGQKGTSRALRKALVVSEVALALVLLIGAGLLIQTFIELQRLDLGIRPDNILVVRTQLPDSKYDKLPNRSAFYAGVIERVKNLPGVISAGYGTAVPLTWKGGTDSVTIEGHPDTGKDSYGRDTMFRQISPDYLRALGVSLHRGRFFDDHDGPDSLPVAIINETMAREFWEGDDPLGRRFSLEQEPGVPPKWRTVVGIVGDIREMGIEAPLKAEMFFPYAQSDPFWNAPHDLVVHTSGDPLKLVSAVRTQVWNVDASQPLSNVRTMDDVIDSELVQQRVGMTLLAALAGLALLLAGIGIYGVLSYAVAQRAPEIGVRMALGATSGNVLGMVMSDALIQSVAGVAIGLAGAFVLTRLMSSLLFGVSQTDPLTFASVPLIVLAVSLLASYIPARRATRVDPMTAVRCE
ncbi:MAG TPA: ABC transporter permease [Blastocatellia bacterium]